MGPLGDGERRTGGHTGSSWKEIAGVLKVPGSGSSDVTESAT